jgi:hypothetical protein
LGPLFQHSFDSDDHEDNLDVSNEDHALNPSDELIVFYVNDNSLDDCPQIEISFGELRVTADFNIASGKCSSCH